MKKYLDQIKRQFCFVMITMLFVMISAICVKETVLSQQTGNTKEQMEYIDALEQSYIVDMKEELMKMGYYHSGITMTKTSDMEDNRDYAVRIHNERIKKLSYNQQMILMDQLKEMGKKMSGNGVQIILV